ncbi:hypothetical protein KJ657_02015, partial [Patescibacteria group bacterium]|nr:hypothetical protein [Patescibacteria group bacterium]
MRQEHFSSREGGSKSIITERYRKLVYAAMAATALGVSACGGENPNNNPDGGAGTGGGGTGGTTEGGGGTGGGGANPCEGLMFEGLAGEEVSPGETGTVTVDLGESHPDKAYNGLRMEINGDVLTKPGLAGLMKKTDVTANGDYQLVEMKGFRTLVIDKENNY